MKKKVLDYKSPKELEALLNDNWQVVQAFSYKTGLVLVLQK